MAAIGHEERFPPTRLVSASGIGFSSGADKLPQFSPSPERQPSSGNEGLQTHRWREVDANFHSRVSVLLGLREARHLVEVFAGQDATSGCGRSLLRSLRFARASSVGWQRTTP
jgi:hypothetical protein